MRGFVMRVPSHKQHRSAGLQLGTLTSRVRASAALSRDYSFRRLRNLIRTARRNAAPSGAMSCNLVTLNLETLFAAAGCVT